MLFVRSAGDVIGFLLLSAMAIIEGIVKMLVPARYKMKSVSGEIALVTGGGNGLGRLLSLRLANLGAIVVIWDINKEGKCVTHIYIYIFPSKVTWDLKLKVMTTTLRFSRSCCNGCAPVWEVTFEIFSRAFYINQRMYFEQSPFLKKKK